MTQLNNLDRATVVEGSEASRSAVRSQIFTATERTPNFMNKFVQDSKKLIQEGGKEFFNPVDPVKESSEFLNRFEQFVFSTSTTQTVDGQRSALRRSLA